MKRAGLATLALTVLNAACTVYSAGPRPQPSTEIELASELDVAAAGPWSQRAVALAVAQHPTLDGYRLVHVPLDDSFAGVQIPDKAEQNAKLMVSDSRILGVVGPSTSLVAMAVIGITGRANLVMVSPSATESCLTDRPMPCLVDGTSADNFFRIAATDSFQARAAADLAVRKLGLTRFAVLNDGEPYGLSMSNAFAAGLVAAGGKVVMNQAYSPAEQSYTSLLRQARDAGAEAVYAAGKSFPYGVCHIRAGMSGVFPADAYFISGDYILDATCIADAGPMADDHMVGTISAREPNTVPANLADLPRGRYYDAYNFAAYDCAGILIAAIDRAIRANGGEIPTREQVLRAVAATSGFHGVTGTYSFKANGDATAPAVSFYHVRNRSWVFWENA